MRVCVGMWIDGCVAMGVGVFVWRFWVGHSPL